MGGEYWRGMRGGEEITVLRLLGESVRLRNRVEGCPVDTVNT